MKLSKKNIELIQKEIEFIIPKMEKSNTISEMLYFFTAVYSTMNRILNFEYSEDLLFIDITLENFYKSSMERLQLVSRPGTGPYIPDDEFRTFTIALTKEIKNTMINKTKVINTLKKFTTLAYMSTGNGFYLYEKGMIEIPTLSKN